MKLEDFKSGKYTQEYKYKAFLPNSINSNWIWEDSDINILLDEANRKLGEINAFSYLIPDIDMFIKMHIVKEANTSSKIEGTKTEIDEAVMKEDQISPERRDDWLEVHQYIESMKNAILMLEKLPLSNRLIRETHRILLSTGRDEKKTPGEFRKSQNWIGGRNLSEAKFIPPHNKYLNDLMGDLEKFINENNNVPHLIKLALMHYQFETIHPFLDGNGRVGRLLITLYLIANNILTKPALYLSDYLEKNRIEYYHYLNEARSNKIIQWIKFFLKGISITSENTKQTFVNIIELQQEITILSHTFGSRSEKILKIINVFYENPILSIKELVMKTDIPDKTMRTLINLMMEKNIVKEMTGYSRNKLFVFDRYLKLF
ncbi:MAG: Fic family protein [Candidatus Cloacimonetes bacterium]|nr:Fic family protein [Candidatus Cloacimonadota bacterium]MCF7812918.1 Fic family protein [Candidatus Cloacimonadota bacterium]MCF7867130.1 Fic family protein [Candidatus Cloacimonadota bacterium]MCF7882550.1 Fic family protein [Candidatus Cloacimonadota bacterium]